MSALDLLVAQLASEGTVTLAVKVIPKSSRTEVAGRLADGTLRIKVAAPPEKGKANAELCDFLASEFGVPKANVTIESGHTSPRKRLRVRR